jgi:hypothetical protein
MGTLGGRPSGKSLISTSREEVIILLWLAPKVPPRSGSWHSDRPGVVEVIIEYTREYSQKGIAKLVVYPFDIQIKNRLAPNMMSLPWRDWYVRDFVKALVISFRELTGHILRFSSDTFDDLVTIKE